jgi:hypothetical protein
VDGAARTDVVTAGSPATEKQDATFCAQPGRLAGPGNVSLASVNVAGGLLRHYNEEVWVATFGGGRTWDSSNSFDADVTWNNAAPWS